jgi:murein DD-endopeptidase MepM/ murein hydrolase activator NlpD
MHSFALLLVLAQPLRAEPVDDATRVAERLATREDVLQGQKDRAAARMREQALLAYRLTRRRDLGFVSNPQLRLDEAEAADLALAALGKGLAETRVLTEELGHVRTERVAFDQARGRQADPPKDSDEFPCRFARPVRGAIVSAPGLKRDAPTGIELRREGIALLARLNESVGAVAAGVVRQVENLPQGGYAVVTQHPARWVSVVSGMRDVVVAPGDPVEPGQPLGLAGRNLDGAAVVSIELWRNRQSVDPRTVLPGMPSRGAAPLATRAGDARGGRSGLSVPKPSKGEPVGSSRDLLR